MKPSTLLVMNENPENLRFYLLASGSRQAAWAVASDNLMLGEDEVEPDHDIHKLMDWLATDEGKACEAGTPIKGNIDCVVSCGYFCKS